MTQIYEYVKMAFSNIRHNKVRSFLTMLGIIIGISSVILIMGIGNGAKNVITSEMADIGEGQIYVYSNDYTGTYVITNDDIEKIKKMEGVKGVTVQDGMQGQTQVLKGDFGVNIACVMPDYKYFMNTGIADGRFFTESEYESGTPVCIIGEKDAISLFGTTNVVGMKIPVDIYGTNVEFKIVGIEKAKSDSFISFDYGEKSVSIIVPETMLRKVYGIEIDNFQGIYILADKHADTYTLAQNITALLDRVHKIEDGEDMYMVENFSDYMSMVNTVINIVTLIISLIAAISLFVGGIGVMNIMLVSVTERTREIGIRKSLGAKTRSIMFQFLAESVIITLIGGMIGVILGVAGASGIASIVSMINPSLAFTPEVSAGAVMGAAAFSSAVGIFFGIYPARKAAKLSPIEALRRN